jgi:inositol-phosphate phosphatase/L-galactose 1-phosphate phosphatase/histidinol-phosphatase
MDAATLFEDGHHFAELAAELAKGFFCKPIEISFKQDQSPVTFADQSIEKQTRAAILEKYPDHSILGEEYGIDGSGLDNLWVIDPIDGTRSFLSGHPLFGFLLGYLEAGDPKLGIIGMPVLGEIYCGIKGAAATCNGAEIHVSTQTNLADAILYVNEGEKIYDAHPTVFAKLMQSGQTRRFAYDCYPHALLAAGHVDAVVDYDLKPYDFLALGPVVEGAGGIMTTWTGQKPDLTYEGPIISAATPELHAQLVDLLQLEC